MVYRILHMILRDDRRRPNKGDREVKVKWEIFGSIKHKFNQYDPKSNNFQSFKEFRPISLCNCRYKTTTNVIA